MKMPIRIMVVEDNAEYRDVLELTISRESDMMLLSQFGSAEMALGSLVKNRSGILPEVILLDLRLPGMSGLEAIPHFQERLPGVKILILSQSDEQADVMRAITLGVAGYLLKSSTVQQVKEGIRSVVGGGASIDPSVARYLVNSLRGQPLKLLSNKLLSERELEVLELLADGLTKKEIGERLYISYPTVDAHVRHIYEKLDVKNAPAAVRRAYRIGVFASEEWL